MVQIDHRLPLMVQGPNVLASLDQGTRAASNQANVLRQAEGQNLFREYGAGAMQGDPTAMNALAGFDPVMAQGMDINRQENRRAETRLGIDQERLSMLKAETARALSEAEDQAAAAREAQEIARLAPMGERLFLNRDQAGWQALTQEIGIDLPFDESGVAALFAMREGASMVGAMRGPQPEWRPATPEEAATYGATAGQINDKTGQFQRTPVDSTMEIVTNPDGSMSFRQGPGAGQEDGRMAPSSPGYMIDSIDGILNDPALDFATGWRSWTQNIPGTDARRFGARARQLEGQAFLQAFESLKGGGQITEVEGLKATQAIGRLDTAQKPEDYRAALTELRDILAAAQTRPQGWADTQGQPAQSPTPETRAREVEINGRKFRVEPLDE